MNKEKNTGSRKRKSDTIDIADVTKPKRYQYSNLDLQNALRRVEDGENALQVAKSSTVPYSTIRKKLNSKCDGKKLICMNTCAKYYSITATTAFVF